MHNIHTRNDNTNQEGKQGQRIGAGHVEGWSDPAAGARDINALEGSRTGKEPATLEEQDAVAPVQPQPTPEQLQSYRRENRGAKNRKAAFFQNGNGILLYMFLGSRTRARDKEQPPQPDKIGNS